jgi:hypothetical protein
MSSGLLSLGLASLGNTKGDHDADSVVAFL